MESALAVRQQLHRQVKHVIRRRERMRTKPWGGLEQLRRPATGHPSIENKSLSMGRASAGGSAGVVAPLYGCRRATEIP